MSITSSTTHRVLCIPELLDMIFGFLDPPSNAKNAQVCKTWLNVALDVLWKDVESPRRLFGLLAPLKEKANGKYEFERLPDADDWKKFDKYGTRVRRFRYCNHHQFLKSVFDDIARTRRRLEILPNLRTLEWLDASVNLSVLFMHNGIKNFMVYIPDEMTTISPRPFFQDLADRMPNLTNFDLRSHVPVGDIEEELIDLLKQLPKLQKIIFPRFYVTTEIAEALSRMERLSVIEFQYNEDQGSGDSTDVVSVKPTFSEGAFPALYDLSLTTYFDDAARFFNIAFAPTNLTMICIASETAIESPERVQTLLSAIAENCQLLTMIAIMSYRDTSVIGFEAPDGCNLTIDTLKPILKLPNLTSFEIVHHYPLCLSLEDIEMLASSCPSIETLLLNTEPVFLAESKLTLDSLLPFAKHCPRLSHLGLFVDATNVPEFSPTAQPKPFTNLSRLSMGVSIIADDAPPALYLSQLLPSTVEIDCGVTWDEDERTNETLTNIARDRWELWDRVAQAVPMLSTLRMQERERTRAMERELEDLRMRTAVLRDSMAMGIKLDLSTCVLI